MADFVLGRLKFVWKGDWVTGTSYIADDVVRYGGNTYVALVNHTASGLFETDLTASPVKWGKMAAGFEYKGNYVGDSATYYKVDDVVKNGSSLWVCTTSHYASAILDETKFNVFVPGLEFEDSWSVSTTYQKGDIVTYGGYTYVAVSGSTGVTPSAAASEWDVLTTGFSLKGTYSAGTAYSTGDVVKYGGNTYVNKLSHTAGAQLPTNTSYYDLLVEGISLQGDWSSGTNYKIGEVVIYLESSWRAVRDNVGVTPTVSASADWAKYNQGDPAAVFTTQGDIVKRGSAAAERLPRGRAGEPLIATSTDIRYATDNIGISHHVSPTGSDSNPGSEFLPYKTIKYALTQCKSNRITGFDSIAGGTGGTPGTYLAVSGTGGSGSGATFDVVLDGSSTPVITINDGGSNFAVGNTITISSGIGGATNITFNITDISYGDVVICKNGIYQESLPLVVPARTSLYGTSLRGTRVKPASGNGSQIATLTNITGGTTGTPGTYNYVRQASTSGSGLGLVVNVVTDGSSTPTVTIIESGHGYAASDTITFNGSSTGNSSNVTVEVASLKANNVSQMFLLNDATNIRHFTFTDMVAGGKITSLDPNGGINTASPYIQNCTTAITSGSGVTGIYIDGKAQASGNKSILANDFTQIISDGTGVHVINSGRAELVSVFTYYCDKAIHAETGGFVRSLNSSMAYGEYGAYANGTDPDETPVTVQVRGQQLEYTGNISGAGVSYVHTDAGTDIAQGVTSGATANIINHISSTKVLKIENVVGTFVQGEQIEISLPNSTKYYVTLESGESGFGDSTGANKGQRGLLFHVKSTDGTLGTAGVIKVGSNIFFNGDATAYAVTAVSSEDTGNETALVRVTTEKTTSVDENDNATVRNLYSNIRMTGHDFLSIGTGGFADTGYPNSVGVAQPADQGREVTELSGGRVYYTSTDQDGDFRVGDLFRVEQSTGIATLNADAFDLSGLTELQLGSIGAQIGATINEFSTDGTLSGNSDIAVPTEQAVKTYVDTNSFSTGKAIAMAIVFG